MKIANTFVHRAVAAAATAFMAATLLGVQASAALFSSDVAINVQNFPDANFRSYVSENFDTDGNGTLSKDEIGNATVIYCLEEGEISDFTGLQYLTELEILWCPYESLTALDVSKNTKLRALYGTLYEYVGEEEKFSGCNLSSLDVSNNPELEELYCSSSNLTNLDLSHNPKLRELECNNNQLTALDVSNNPLLEMFSCDSNQLTTLDVTHNPELWYISCSNNQLTSIDITCNTKLENFCATGNQLTSLDVSHCTLLWEIACGNNQLTSIDISANPNLFHVYFIGNQSKTLDSSHNPELEYIDVDANVKVSK